MTDPILRTEGLTKNFGGVVATNDVSSLFRRASCAASSARTGRANRTLFSLLCGIHRADAGRVLLKGADVTRLPAFRRVRRGIGLTFQTNRAFHALTVRQNLEIARRADGAARTEAAEERYRFALDLSASRRRRNARAGAAASSAAMARDRDGAGGRARHRAARRADRRHVAGGDAADRRGAPAPQPSPASPSSWSSTTSPSCARSRSASRCCIRAASSPRARSTRSRRTRTCAASTWGRPEPMDAILEVSDLRAGYATGDVLQGVEHRASARARSWACSAATAWARPR